MKNFEYFLNKTQEVGYIDQVSHSIMQIKGLPQAHPGEVVIFESDELGFVLGLDETYVEVLLLSPGTVPIGTRVTRTETGLKINVGEQYLGKVITGKDLEKDFFVLDEDDQTIGKKRPVESKTQLVESISVPFAHRNSNFQTLETGTTIVDLLVPLAKGQRELVIGDRKTGKSHFLLKTVHHQALQKNICIYAAIAKPQLEIQRIADILGKEDISQQTMLIASNSAQRAGLIFLTPYIAMTMAEYFARQGKDVILVLDDLTTHARYYRELMLLAKRFPGRNSYPGDIFYVHARLLERAGNFATGSITCLPAAQSVLGDLSGYIQTNIMAMTDGHIFFDADLFDQGRRPAVNPFLSVTRVGEKSRTRLQRNISLELRAFLVHFEQVKQFKHFQTELSESIQETFETGDRITAFMDQLSDVIVPASVDYILYTGILAEAWRTIPIDQMKKEMAAIVEKYNTDEKYRELIQATLTKFEKFADLIAEVKNNEAILWKELNEVREKLAKEAAAQPQPTAPTNQQSGAQ